jgi:hypothetical protein
MLPLTRARAVKSVEEMLRPVDDQALKQEMRSAMLGTPAYVGLSAMEGMLDDKIWTEDQISVPVLTVLAASPGWKSDTEAYYRSVAPELEFHMWAGVSHFLMMERLNRVGDGPESDGYSR